MDTASAQPQGFNEGLLVTKITGCITHPASPVWQPPQGPPLETAMLIRNASVFFRCGREIDGVVYEAGVKRYGDERIVVMTSTEAKGAELYMATPISLYPELIVDELRAAEPLLRLPHSIDEVIELIGDTPVLPLLELD
ncbi:MAG TPA: hypothetical protein VN701_00475 [Candidatus Paceibacterota bacterium]|nr:hypothetical protein [Candidatus Paceibacterota bacterium]